MGTTDGGASGRAGIRAAPPRELALATLNRSPLFDVAPETLAHVAAAADAGFTLLSLDIFSLQALGQDVTLLASLLAEHGVGVLDIPSLIVGRGADTDGAALDEVVGLIRALHPRYVIGRVDGPIDPSDTATMAVLRHAARVVADEGSAFTLEPSPVSSLPTLAAGRAVLDELDVPGTGLVVDTWHFFVGEDGWDDLAALPLDQLAFVQLADGDPHPAGDLVRATLNDRSLPGDGQFDLAGFADALRRRGYAGPTSVEVLSARHRPEPVAEFARQAYTRSLPYC